MEREAAMERADPHRLHGLRTCSGGNRATRDRPLAIIGTDPPRAHGAAPTERIERNVSVLLRAGRAGFAPADLDGDGAEQLLRLAFDGDPGDPA